MNKKNPDLSFLESDADKFDYGHPAAAEMVEILKSLDVGSLPAETAMAVLNVLTKAEGK